MGCGREPLRPIDLPYGLRLTGLPFDPRQLTGTVPEWRMDTPRAGLEDILNQLNSAVGFSDAGP